MDCKLTMKTYDPVMGLVRGKRTKRKTTEQEANWLLGRGVRKLGRWIKNTKYAHETYKVEVALGIEGKPDFSE
jgi:hypothetical protein